MRKEIYLSIIQAMKRAFELPPYWIVDIICCKLKKQRITLPFYLR